MKLNIFQWRSLKTRVAFFTLAIFAINVWSLTFYGTALATPQLMPTGDTPVLNKRALILVSAAFGAAATDRYVLGLLNGLKNGGVKSGDISIEYLNLARPTIGDHRQALVNLIAKRYSNADFDVIFCVQQPALNFLLTDIPELAPRATIFGWTAQMPRGAIPGNRQFVFKSMRLDYRGTLQRALELFPRTDRVIVIQGNSDVELSRWENIREDLAPWAGKLQIEDTQALTVEQIEAKLATVPKNTIVMGIGITRDAKGQIHVPPEFIARIVKTANAPFFAVVDIGLDYGAVGGMVTRIDVDAAALSAMAIDVMSGVTRLTAPVTQVSNTVTPVFNWQQLVRWGADPDVLPGNTVFINRPPTLWGQYREYVTASILVLLMFSALMTVLIWQNRKLRLAAGSLSASEERSRAITESAHDAVVTSDSAGNIVGWNRGAETIFGYAESEAMGQPMTLLIPERYRDGHLAGMNRIRSGGEHRIIGKAVELNGLRKGGGEFPLELSLAKWETTDGWFITGVIRDIKERKKAEEALRESEEQFRSLTEMSSDFFWETDAEHRLNERISSAEKVSPVTAFREGKQLGLRRWEIPYLSPDEAGWQAHRVVLDGHLSFRNFELSRLAADGTPSYVSISGDPVFDAAGHFRGYRGVGTDITERKRAEKEKIALETQFQQAQKMDSVGHLAGGVAHDFNNMLTVILGNVAMAIEQVDSTQPIHTDLVEIRKAATRSADLTRQLLAFARKQVIEPKVLDLNQALAGIVKMLQRLIGEDISLKWVPETNLWPVKIDPSQLDQILANLCINARDAIAGVGNIAIETGNITFDEDYCAVHAGFAPGDYVRLAVSDNGHGIDKETLAHIFEPFFTTKGVGEGTGLGLATVYGVVKQNNGFINVYSEPDTGTTFTIYLPRHEGEAKQESAAGAAGPLVRGHETVLLVEDEPSILKLTTRILTRQGYAVLPAKSPVEAIRLASEYAGTIHLLMTDVVMPEMNGRDLANQLQSRYPGLKVLFMSGYTANIIVHQGVLDQGVQFIQKPFAVDDLAAKVREVLDSE